jgi:hypothetical protein
MQLQIHAKSSAQGLKPSLPNLHRKQITPGKKKTKKKKKKEPHSANRDNAQL